MASTSSNATTMNGNINNTPAPSTSSLVVISTSSGSFSSSGSSSSASSSGFSASGANSTADSSVAQPTPKGNRLSLESKRRSMVVSITNTKDIIPPALHPLLHGLSLLQTAVQNGRSAHYQPSAACIIASVRTILTDVGCLAKESPVLARRAELREGRKVLLSALADLVGVAQAAAKLAREKEENEEEEEDDDEGEEVLLGSMLRIAGMVFSSTRRFLGLVEVSGLAMGHSRESSVSSLGSSASASSTSADE